MKLALLCLALATFQTFGRPIYNPSLQELWAQADLVAVIRPLSTTNAPDQLTSAGPKYGARDPQHYRAMNTRCAVVFVMKPSEGLQESPTNELTLLHFRYAPNVPEFNGGRFMYFDLAPAELNLTVKGGPASPVGRDTEPTYLAFLKRGVDGRFIPVTGHYDSEASFRVLVTPTGGATRYLFDDAPRPKQGRAKDPVQPPESGHSVESTNRTSGATGPRRSPGSPLARIFEPRVTKWALATPHHAGSVLG